MEKTIDYLLTQGEQVETAAEIKKECVVAFIPSTAGKKFHVMRYAPGEHAIDYLKVLRGESISQMEGSVVCLGSLDHKTCDVKLNVMHGAPVGFMMAISNPRFPHKFLLALDGNSRISTEYCKLELAYNEELEMRFEENE